MSSSFRAAGPEVERRLAELSPEKRRLLESMVRERGAEPAIPRFGLDRAPLSFGQERLWFLHQYDSSDTSYHLHVHLVLPLTLDIELWGNAWTQLIERHEILRTRFVQGENGPEQVVQPPGPVELPVYDLRDLPVEEARKRASAIATQQADTPFDLSSTPLFRMALVRMAGKIAHVMTIHHIVTDGWSIDVMMREVNAAYVSAVAGKPVTLPPLPLQYADFARWQRQQLTGETLQPLLAYWRAELDGIVPLELPADRPRPARFTGAAGVRTRILPQALTRRLNEMAQREGLTQFMVMLAGFAALLHRYTGQEDLVLGTPVAGRDHARLEGLIGFFLNTILLRVPVHGTDTFHTLLKAVKDLTVRAYSHQQLPFARLVEELQPERDLRRNALYQVTFQLLLSREPRSTTSTVLDEISYRKRSTDVDLAVDLIEGAEGLAARFEFCRDLFDDSSVDRMLAHWERLLERLVADPDRSISELPLTSESERVLLVEEWSGRRDAPPLPAPTLGAWLSEVFLRFADETAIISPNGALTYRDLQELTDRLAAGLQRRGAGPEQIVAIHFASAVETIAAILACWKIGAAYVYIDPELPQQRIDELFAQSNPCVLLADLEELWHDVPSESFVPKPVPHDNRVLAAVIFTSGSAGKPKGVLLEQRSLLQQIAWFQRDLRLTPQDRVLQKYPFGFDAALAELLTALASGAALVTTREQGADLDEVVALVRGHGIGLLDVVPSTLSALLQHPHFQECVSVRRIICGGERLAASAVNRCHELLPHVDVINAYGPTEATITATHWLCPREPLLADPPIGRPVPGYEVYVLDSAGEPVPIGMEGELYIGGAGLARGYLGDDKLTEVRFVPHPFRQDTRLYATGDRARFREDATVEFRGRRDQQVKLRGFRIELEELEAALREHPAVADAAAVVVSRSGLDDEARESLLARLEGMSQAEAGFLYRFESQDAEVRRNTMFMKSPQFELYLQLLDPEFVRTPRESQRNWLLRRGLKELAADLESLDRRAKTMVSAGERPEMGADWESAAARYSTDELLIDGQQVMQAWERPLMSALAEAAAESHGDVLEVGFGMGISAALLQQVGVRSHTILECNQDVGERAEAWAGRHRDAPIRIVHSRWQDWDAPEAAFDGILFDTYPTSEEEYLREVIESPVFAAGFFATAARALRPGGVFTYYSNEIDSLSREHQRLLLRHFRRFSVSVVDGLQPPPDCQYWWAESMVVVKAVR